jgi:hypothetical protein
MAASAGTVPDERLLPRPPTTAAGRDRVTTELVHGTITASKPVDWYSKESHVFLSPDGRANVVVSSEPLEPDIDSRTYADVQGALLEQEFADYSEHSFEATAVFGGRAGFRRRFSWRPEDSEPVIQVQLYYAEAGRGYTATATSAEDDHDLFELTLLELLGSLRIA